MYFYFYGLLICFVNNKFFFFELLWCYNGDINL